MSRTVFKGEATFEERPFLSLFADSIFYARLAAKKGCRPEFIASHSRVSVLMSVFAAEAALNSALMRRKVSKSLRERVERFPFVEKAEFIANSLGYGEKFQAEAPSIADMAEIIKLRNQLAHPKNSQNKASGELTEAGTGRFDIVTKALSPRLKISLISNDWNAEVAFTAIKVVDSFLEHFFHTLCALNTRERRHVFQSSIHLGNGTSVILHQKRASMQLRYARRIMKIRCGYFYGKSNLFGKPAKPPLLIGTQK